MGPNSCPTCVIQTEPSADNPSGKVVINESDFDEATMTKCEPDAPTPEAPEAPLAENVVPPVDGATSETKIVAPWKV